MHSPPGSSASSSGSNGFQRQAHDVNSSRTSHSCNGESPKKPFSAKLNSQEKDTVRLIGQFLRSKGLEQTAHELVAESGLKLEHEVAERFRRHITEGSWALAEKDLQELKGLMADPKCTLDMRFYILEQKYLELLESEQLMEALMCLRNEITPLNFNTEKVHKLTQCMMCTTPEELHKASDWPGKGPTSRQNLLEKLQKHLPPSLMLPPRRLEQLLAQSVQLQKQQCPFHNSDDSDDNLLATLPSDDSTSCLLTDHVCNKDDFPCHTSQVLMEHGDEVWFCRFSPDGTMLASGSKEGHVVIWNVDSVTHRVTLRYSLHGHSHGVAYLAWSPDSSKIIACGPDDCGDLWLWDVVTGRQIVKMSHSQDDSLTCAAFYNDGKKFVAAGTRGQFYQCDLEGHVLDQWEGLRVQCLSCVPGSQKVIAADTHYRLRAYNFDDMVESSLIQEDHPVMSFTISADGRLALLNVATQGLHIWDIEDKVLVRKLQGLKQGFYAIHSCFGGVNQNFVASGSEDNTICIWHVRRERPLVTLEGHTKTVNCVHWNPTDPTMLASASDDGSVRIWGPASRAEKDSQASDGSGRSTPV